MTEVQKQLVDLQVHFYSNYAKALHSTQSSSLAKEVRMMHSNQAVLAGALQEALQKLETLEKCTLSQR